MVKNSLQLMMISVLAVSSLAGCTQEESATDPNADNMKTSQFKFPDEPLTLRMYQSSANISDDEFHDLIADPVKKKFPNVTMEIVRPAKKKEDLITAGEFPDLIYTNTTVIQEYVDLDLPLDLNPLIKKYNFDLGQFNQRPFDDIKAYSSKGQLFGVPFSVNFDVLYYNKDIFDKFGVSYPKDGMTWDEVIALGKKVTREENGIKYEGIYPTLIKYFSSQLSVPFVNPKTMRAELTTDGWKKVFETYKAIMDAQGGTDPGASLGKFNKNQTLAMMAHYGARVGELEQLLKEGKPVNWDMVSYPTFKELPGISQGLDTHYLMISTTGKQQEAAFQVLSFLTSGEAQMNVSRRGRVSALKDPKIREQFGADVQTLKGKNIQAVFKSTPAPLPVPTKYDGLVKEPNLQKYANEFLKGTADVNTILKQLEETVNKDIEARKAGN
ncbi:ABC transporter substrate-binding protein [Paenibacillus allorhizosphaerae]|uniref:Extracellular solute-binding protein n=1 Tax=Paenibacillus allorhizosphaerae TaxID=2849866 RepID=A0ABM8VQM8_9BACL|nr:extracellular solute-binding protein [Paenibacillus allorhizosphaerae]CAG7654395.1 hypothetical protein PAECIP111802_05762 [Paenibacillus allorhizosphaerae]